MSDDNRELIAALARRPTEDDPPLPPTKPVPVVSGSEWNSPIDTLQADCMTEREVIRGIVAGYKEQARRWEPRPYPDGQ